MKPRLAISFSGGRTSGYMLLHCLKEYGLTHDIVVTFANTGCEHPATLDFVHQCDKHIGGKVVWLEAVINPEAGVGVRHKIVTYETASRNGEPFEAFISKYGIPNSTNPNCTGRLKTDVMEDYIKSLGWKRGVNIDYDTAIGIRADEVDRMSAKAAKYRFVYPLVKIGITKQMVIDFWKNQPFDLRIPGEHYGNCVWCWKKTLRKLMTLSIESPDVFDFPKRMEENYGHVKGYMKSGNGGKRVFFRKYMTVEDIFDKSKQPFEPYSENHQRFVGSCQISLFENSWDNDLDIGSACGDSCEIGADENG